MNQGTLTLKVIIAVLVAGIVAAGGALATQTWDPLWNPFRPEPDQVIDKTVESGKKIKTVYSEATLDLKTEGATEPFSLNLTMEGDSDNSDPKTPKSRMDLEAELGIEGVEFSFSLTSRTIGDSAYFKVTEIPAPALPTEQARGLKNQWVKAELKPEQAEQKKKVMKEIQELFDIKKLVEVEQELADQQLNQSQCYHYLVRLNQEELKEVLVELLESMASEFSPTELTEQQRQQMRGEMEEDLDEFFNKVGPIEGEIWIGKKNFFLRRIKTKKEITADQWKEIKQGKLVFDLEMTFSNFNQPVEIKVPEGAKPLKEILGPFGPSPAPRQPVPSEPAPEFPQRETGGPASVLDALESLLK